MFGHEPAMAGAANSLENETQPKLKKDTAAKTEPPTPPKLEESR
jgi:hypothetical protein